MKIYHMLLNIEFNMPVTELYEILGNHERFGQIIGQKITRVKDSTDPTDINGVNSVRKIHAPLIPFEETIIQTEIPNLIVYKITKNSPLAHHLGTMKLTSLDSNRSALQYDIEIGSNIPLFGGLVKKLLEHNIGGGLRKLANNRG